MWREPGNPFREWDNKIVAFPFFHSFHDCIQLFHDGWIVAVLPISHEVFLQAVHDENVRAPDCHDTSVVLQQFSVQVW